MYVDLGWFGVKKVYDFVIRYTLRESQPFPALSRPPLLSFISI